MGKETYSKSCKDSQTQASIEISMKSNSKDIWCNWSLTYLMYGMFGTKQTAQCGGVLGEQ